MLEERDNLASGSDVRALGECSEQRRGIKAWVLNTCLNTLLEDLGRHAAFKVWG
jgi:hypothetical protein